MTIEANLRTLARRWSDAAPAERSNAQSYLTELCDALEVERVREEKLGEVRWLRPEYQIPRFGQGLAGEATMLQFPGAIQVADDGAPEPWPSSAWEQIRALQIILGRNPATVEEAARHFRGARRDLVSRHLETLTLMGEARRDSFGAYHLVRETA